MADGQLNGTASNGNSDGPGLFPEGLAYNPSTDTLLLSAGNGGSSMWLYELELDGTFVDPARPALFQFPTGAWRGLDYMQGSSTLLASRESGLIQEFTLAGASVVGGISFQITDPAADDAEGVVLGPDGALYVADDGNETLRRFTGSGSSWTEDTAFRINTRNIATNFDDPSGIEIRPLGGGLFNILVHDDSSGGFGGVWDVNLAGQLQGTVLDSKVLTANVPGCSGVGGCYDGEAFAYDDANDVFFIAYENEQRIVSYPRAPEPSAALLLLVALGALGRRIRSA